MQRKTVFSMILILMVGFFVACCGDEKDLDTVSEVLPETVEFPDIAGIKAKVLDNGKNVGWIGKGANVQEAATLLQYWIDKHPDKKVIAVSGGRKHHTLSTEWLFIYEDRE